MTLFSDILVSDILIGLFIILIPICLFIGFARQRRASRGAGKFRTGSGSRRSGGGGGGGDSDIQI